eukprot:Gb_14808 [translate_table: standard]
MEMMTVTNLLFLESPAGVGFSYTNTSSNLKDSGDNRTTEDALIFLINWLARFPQYEHGDFYICVENYEGHYVPQLARKIYEYNKRNSNPIINLKGFMVGNAVTDDYYDSVGTVRYWWTHSMISDKTYRTILDNCNFTQEDNSPFCDHYMLRFIASYDPCTENYGKKYYDRPDVQEALHANTTKILYGWTGCSVALLSEGFARCGGLARDHKSSIKRRIIIKLPCIYCLCLHAHSKQTMPPVLNFVLSKFVPCHYPLDLLERLWAVDTVDCLGIDRYFKKEIKESLDYVYRGVEWARCNPIPDVDDTAMGLRIWRLHGYNISSDVLENFRDEKGDFFCFAGQTQIGVTDNLNLYRCSQVCFMGEKIMEEANTFTTNHLQNALAKNNAFDKRAVKKDLPGEVEYALKYPWHKSMPRLEARSYIEQFGSNDVWLGKTVYKPYTKRRLNTLSGFNDLTFTHQWPVEMYFSVAVSMFEPEFAACRIAYAKTSCLAVILDDLYDTHGSLDDLKLFFEAVRRWDISVLDSVRDNHTAVHYQLLSHAAATKRLWQWGVGGEGDGQTGEGFGGVNEGTGGGSKFFATGVY